MTIKVLLVDDEALLRTGLRMILESQDDIEVVGEADDGGPAVDAVLRLNPHVVLMDIRMKSMDGITATKTILAQTGARAKIVVLTTFDADEHVYEALRAGATAFLLKDASPEQLVDAVRVAARGDALLHPVVTRRLISDFARRPPRRDGPPPELEELTERELEVLRLVAAGLSNAEIAREIFLSEATVKTHVAHFLAKLGLRDRVQAVVVAYETGLVQPGERHLPPQE